VKIECADARHDLSENLVFTISLDPSKSPLKRGDFEILPASLGVRGISEILPAPLGVRGISEILPAPLGG
jgi:hypothetical protein